MEFLLLWADEIDDALGALRHLAGKVFSLIGALALFAATGFALILTSQTILFALALVLCTSLLEAVRRRRARMADDHED